MARTARSYQKEILNLKNDLRHEYLAKHATLRELNLANERVAMLRAVNSELHKVVSALTATIGDQKNSLAVEAMAHALTDMRALFKEVKHER